jgi:hypothetical protein
VEIKDVIVLDSKVSIPLGENIIQRHRDELLDLFILAADTEHHDRLEGIFTVLLDQGDGIVMVPLTHLRSP